MTSETKKVYESILKEGGPDCFDMYVQGQSIQLVHRKGYATLTLPITLGDRAITLAHITAGVPAMISEPQEVHRPIGRLTSIRARLSELGYEGEFECTAIEGGLALAFSYVYHLPTRSKSELVKVLEDFSFD